MKLILHIGTHKTGTTALQQFLYSNRKPLAAHGFHYASPPGRTEANLIANALNVGNKRIVYAFLAKQVQYASRTGADVVLVSAENFYAMSVLDAMQRRQVCATAVERDHALIETLRLLIPTEVDACEIVCYFRRPDRYAESLYSQHVKRGIIFDGPFEEFLPIIRPALLYNEHMQAWGEAFGDNSCNVRMYEPVRADVVSDFIRQVMGIGEMDHFAQSNNQGNERVSRDVLEFKRLKNRTARPNERDIERTILRLIDEEMNLRKTEPDYYQDFLSPEQRSELLELVEPEIEALQTRYNMPPFPRFELEGTSANWSPYPGLSEQRRQEIQWQYEQIDRRIAFRIDRLVLRSTGFLRRNVPSAGVLFDFLKTFGAKHVFQRAMRRIQLGSG